MAMYYVTSLAKDLSDIALGKQTSTWFNDSIVGLLRIVNSFIFCLCSVAAYLIFINWYEKKGLLKTILGYIVSLLLIITLRYLIQEKYGMVLSGFRNYPKHISLLYYYIDNLGLTFYYSILGIAFFFFDFVKKKELEQKEIQLQNRIAELSFLRAQINPHFLFNCINNIYSLVSTQPQTALPVLGQLSNLIRYMLYESQEQVQIKKEIKYLVDYIELQKIRYTHPERIEVTFSLERMDLKIVPLLLLPFVENVFKHADLSSSGGTALITLVTQEKNLMLTTFNKKQQVDAKHSYGIGLENAKRRLQLLYPSKHTLNIKDNYDDYSVSLTIDLQKTV